MTSLHWQTSLQNRQCHALCTLGRTSKCHKVLRPICLWSLHYYYCPQWSCGKVIFLHLSVSHSAQGGSLSQHAPQVTWRGVSVQGGLCPGVSVQGVSVQGVSDWVGSLSGGEVSVQGVLCQGDPRTGAPYGNARAVRILLECILVFT